MAESKVGRMWALPSAQLSAPMSLLMQGGDDTMLDLPCPSFLIGPASFPYRYFISRRSLNGRSL